MPRNKSMGSESVETTSSMKLSDNNSNLLFRSYLYPERSSLTSPALAKALSFPRDERISACGKANSADKRRTTSRDDNSSKASAAFSRDGSTCRSVANSRRRQSVSDNFASFAIRLMLLARQSDTLAFFSSFSATLWSLLSSLRADFLSNSSFSSCAIQCSNSRARAMVSPP